MYYFNDDGVCSDGNELHNLFIVDAEIIATQGTTAAKSEETPPPSVDVDINNVTSTTDKLLYNMSQSIAGMQESLKGIKNTMSGQEGEDRVLRGYRIQFESRDGRYNCINMDIQQTDKESGVRPVNINTIKYLIFDDVKYVVE